MMLGLKHAFQLGWLYCGSALLPGEHQSLRLEDQGQKLAPEIGPRWSVPVLGRGNIPLPSCGNSCPSTGQLLPHESSPIVSEMLCAIVVPGEKALIVVCLHPGNSPSKSICSHKGIFSAQIRSWGVHQTPSCTSKHS